MPISPPVQIAVPFATSGLKNAIPPTTNNVTGNAGYDAGFGAINMTPKTAGGIPPFGQDFNGIFFDVTTALQYLEAGGSFPYNSTFSTAIGGYPLGAIVSRTDGSGLWRNTVANNTTNPETFGAGWQPEDAGSTSIAMTNANVTLTALQAARSIIFITGVLTANLQLILPTYVKQWLIVNGGTGAFAVTAKTAAGSGIVVGTGASQTVYGDGTNIQIAQPALSGNGQCLLSVASTTSIVLKPYNGNCVIVNGAPLQIPLAGVSVSNGGLAASTTYFAYLSGNSTSPVLELSTTGHSQNTNGIEIKTGDPTRTLVGLVRTSASTTFIDSVTQRHCINWFNRKNIQLAAFGASFTVSSPTQVNVSSALNLTFVTWGDEAVDVSFEGTVTGSTTASRSDTSLSQDLTGGTLGSTQSGTYAAGTYAIPVGVRTSANMTEGFHTTSLFGGVTAGSAIYAGGMHTVIRG